MDQLEKVEKLRERADVSYEEAKAALEASGWDLLDAMVYLEKQGKTKKPQRETYTTNCDDDTQYVSVKEKVQEQQDESSSGMAEKLRRLVRILIKKSRDNFFCVTRKEEELFRVPVWALMIAMLFLWHILIPVMLIALFFDCHYSFKGKDNLDGVNKAMDKASELADRVKDGYEKL